MDKKQIIVLAIMIIISFFWLQREAERARQREEAQAQQAGRQQDKGSAEQAPVAAPAPDASQAPLPSRPGKEQDTAIPAISATTAQAVAELPDIIVETKNYEAAFTNRGGALKRFTLKKPYVRKTKKTTSPLTLLDQIKADSVPSFAIDKINNDTGLASRNYRVISRPADNEDSASPGPLVFQAEINNWRITKTYTFASPEANPAREKEALAPANPLEYGIRLKIKIENLAPKPRDLSWWLAALSGFIPDDLDSRFGRVNFLAGSRNDAGGIEILTKPVSSLVKESLIEQKAGRTVWLGVKGRFFAALLRLDTPDRSGAYAVRHLALALDSEYLKQHPALLPFVKNQPDSAVAFWQILESRPLAPGQPQETDFLFYGGPVKASQLAFDPDFSGVVTYSWKTFDPISRLFSKLLKLLYKIIPNYGICIILATLLIKTSMHGLSRKAMAGQHKMQKLQPLIKEIKEKYKGDAAKTQQETMRLWREHGVSPWGSCLPMLVQIPVFIALYGTFARDFSIRQAMFIPGWIEDLSRPDQLFPLGFSIPFLGWNQFNLLPILYVAMQLVQQSMTPKSNDSQMQQQQQMMKFMPLIFMFIFYTMPSGLVLYFTVSAGYTLVEHWFIRKRIDSQESAKAEVLPSAAGQGFASVEEKKGGGKKKRGRAGR